MNKIIINIEYTMDDSGFITDCTVMAKADGNHPLLSIIQSGMHDAFSDAASELGKAANKATQQTLQHFIASNTDQDETDLPDEVKDLLDKLGNMLEDSDG